MAVPLVERVVTLEKIVMLLLAILGEDKEMTDDEKNTLKGIRRELVARSRR